MFTASGRERCIPYSPTEPSRQRRTHGERGNWVRNRIEMPAIPMLSRTSISACDI